MKAKTVEKLLVHSHSGRMNEIVMCHVHSKMKTPSAHAMPQRSEQQQQRLSGGRLSSRDSAR